MESLKAEIMSIVSEVAEVPADRLGEHTSLAELGVDSLDALRIVAAIEKKYKLEVAEEQIGAVVTISDIVSLVAASA
jgi:acyl carrier protein